MASKARELANLGNAYSDGALSNRNLIINGAMQVAQRGTSFTSDGYTLDRWRIGVYAGQGGAVTVTQQAFTPSSTYPNLFKNYLQFAISSVPSTDSQNLHQRIEDVLTANGQQVTLSFWAKVTSGTYSLDTAFNNSGGGSGGATASESHSLTTTWTKFTHTVQLSEVTGGSTGSATFLRMDFTFPRTEGAATIQITGVQLEVGDTATPFEHRSYGQELALCQRYYHRITQDGSTTRAYCGIGRGEGTGTLVSMFPLPVTMRAIPTHSISSTSDIFANGSGNIDGVSNWSNDGSTQTFGSTGAGASTTSYACYSVGIDHSTSGWIAFDAEL